MINVSYTHLGSDGDEEILELEFEDEFAFSNWMQGNARPETTYDFKITGALTLGGTSSNLFKAGIVPGTMGRQSYGIGGKLDLSDATLTLGVSGAVTLIPDASYIFNSSKISEVILPNNFLDNAQKAYQLFNGCTELTTVDLSNQNLININQSAEAMFKGCTKLKTVKFGKLDLSNATTVQDMFSGCSSLESITISGYTAPGENTVSTNMFYNCTSLPNFDSTKVDDTMAYLGGYFDYPEDAEFLIQLKSNNKNVYPKTKASTIDGLTQFVKNIFGEYKIVAGTEAEINAISPKDEHTFYVVKGE